MEIFTNIEQLDLEGIKDYTLLLIDKKTETDIFKGFTYDNNYNCITKSYIFVYRGGLW